MLIRTSTYDDLQHIIKLDQQLYPENNLGQYTLSHILEIGISHVMIIDDQIVGYICVNNLLVNQLSENINIELEKIILKSKWFVNKKELKINGEKYFCTISLIGVVEKYKSLLPNLLKQVIKYHAMRKCNTKFIVVFVRKNNVSNISKINTTNTINATNSADEYKKLYQSAGFIFSDIDEPNLFGCPNDNGLMMYKKMSFFDLF